MIEWTIFHHFGALYPSKSGLMNKHIVKPYRETRLEHNVKHGNKHIVPLFLAGYEASCLTSISAHRWRTWRWRENFTLRHRNTGTPAGTLSLGTDRIMDQATTANQMAKSLPRPSASLATLYPCPARRSSPPHVQRCLGIIPTPRIPRLFCQLHLPLKVPPVNGE